MVTRRLFPFVCQKDWQFTKGFRKKLFELMNTFYDMRQEGIILAVDQKAEEDLIAAAAAAAAAATAAVVEEGW